MEDLIETYQCDNCAHQEGRDATKPAVDLWERLDPGSTYTDRECSKCGCLTYPSKEGEPP